MADRLNDIQRDGPDTSPRGKSFNDLYLKHQKEKDVSNPRPRLQPCPFLPRAHLTDQRLCELSIKKQQSWRLYTAADPLNNLTPSPAPTAQLPNTASTSTSMSGGESSSYLPTPPLSGAPSSPPLTSSRPSLALDSRQVPTSKTRECAVRTPSG